MLKQSLQLQLGQRLTMTPQLRQAIHLLQLSTLELRQEINEALESNMMLELDDDSGADASSGNETADAPDDAAENSDIPEELPVDSSWEDIYEGATPTAGSGNSDDPGWDALQNAANEAESLREHLGWQTQFAHFSETDMAIATTIIDAVDDDGYLRDSLENLREAVPVAHGEIELDEMQAVLHRLQCFDPAGVCARDAGECLSLQLRRLPQDDAIVQLALRLVTDHLDELASHHLEVLARRTRADQQQLREAINLIRGLNPHPGSGISATRTEYIIPDVFVKRVRGRWRVELNAEASPRLRVNPLYESLARRVDSQRDSETLRNHLQEARWFIKSLQSRNETLLRVASRIVEHQQGFLEHGEEAMKPLVLREIADEIQMHESTVSRVTTRKYMHTPRGIFEFKYFFSSHVSTADGGECSATAIHAIIRRLIAAEDTRRPLSDNKLADMLANEGIQVARRTVAKYREAMAIPPSNERKNLL